MQSHTRIIELLASRFRRSQECVLQSDANVGTGTLVVPWLHRRAATPAAFDHTYLS